MVQVVHNAVDLARIPERTRPLPEPPRTRPRPVRNIRPCARASVICRRVGRPSTPSVPASGGAPQRRRLCSSKATCLRGRARCARGGLCRRRCHRVRPARCCGDGYHTELARVEKAQLRYPLSDKTADRLHPRGRDQTLQPRGCRGRYGRAARRRRPGASARSNGGDLQTAIAKEAT